MISNTTVIGAIMGAARRSRCDDLRHIGDYHEHYSVIQPLFGYREGVHAAGAMNALLLPSGNTFIADTTSTTIPRRSKLLRSP
ncbi:NADP-dependent malic enzyme [Klebsiella michiganensis]|uniref:NADP-dependent malic enzyme n=1 Tax=Klebsiella michiganensis TaxID=1134687 RepID=A0A7H4MU82_9ENTR|nr:NADP-dependent malic enzyme [Klebsiella michiganensis]